MKQHRKVPTRFQRKVTVYGPSGHRVNEMHLNRAISMVNQGKATAIFSNKRIAAIQLKPKA